MPLILEPGTTLVAATHNPGKAKELVALLDGRFEILAAGSLGLPEPVFPLAAAFAWAVIRPSVLAPIGIFVMGLFLDLLWGGTLGLWPLCLLMAYGVALFGRSMMAGQSRVMLWVWFAGVTALALFTGDLVTMLDVKATPDPIGIGWQFLATSVLYPFSNRLIERFEDADVRFR